MKMSEDCRNEVWMMKAKITGGTHGINTQMRPIDDKHCTDLSSPTASSLYQEIQSFRK